MSLENSPGIEAGTDDDVITVDEEDLKDSKPAGILKAAGNGSGHEVEVEERPKTKKKKKDKGGVTQSRRVVPVWYLFRFASCADIFMIVVGTLMAILAGCGLPGHMLLFGDVIDRFISHDLADNLTSQFNITSNISLSVLEELAMGNNGSGYFCNFTEDSSSSNILKFILSPDRDQQLQMEVGLYSIYYLGLATALFLVSFISVLFWNISAYRQTRRMRLAFFKSIMRQDIGWFDVNPSAELSTRLSDDIEKIQAGIGDKAAIFLQYFSTFIAGFLIAFIRNWKMTLVVGTMLPVLSLLAGLIAKVVATFTVREQNAYASAGAVAEEVLGSIRTVVAFGGEYKEIERYNSHLRKAKYEGFKKSFISSAVTGLLFFVIFSTYALGFWYGAVLVSDCELRSGEIITVFFGVVIASFSLGNALPEIQTFAEALGSATAIFAVIDHEPEIDASKPDGHIPDNLEGNIEFKDIIFKYPARPDVEVLRGLDLVVKKGQTVALVGPSGCGKSTVIQLIQRFYNPIAGEITIDGHHIDTLNLKWLRSNLGVVSQEPVLFDTTIADNIRHGRDDATQHDIEEAAKAANVHDFISQLPDGYETFVGEKGTQLSGGQKQRIAIARALVRDPKILLLDEATSALDTESEKIVQEALDKAREGRTTIVIAHRLSTIQTADVIASIENGRIIEMGTHEELMRNNGLYYELVMAQTIAQKEEEENTSDSLSGFRLLVNRSASKHSFQRQRSSQSTSSNDTPSFLRQSSTASKSDHNTEGNELINALSDHLSRISLEDLPIAAHASPSLPRKFNSPTRIVTSPLANTTNATTIASGETKNEHHLVKNRSKKLLIIKSTPSQSDKGVTFDTEDETVRLKKNSVVQDEQTPEKVSFIELIKLNMPDWFLVIPGIFFSALLGASFPMMAIIFSSFLGLFSLPDRNALLSGASEFAGYFMLLAVCAAAIQFIATVTLNLAGERLTGRVRIDTFTAMLRQEMSWFDRTGNSTGALTSQLATDSSLVKGATGIRFGTTMQLMFGFITAVIIAFTASWLLSIVLFACFPFIVAVGFFQIRLLRGRSAKNKELIGESGKIATEVIDNIRTVASLSIEDKFYNQYNDLLKPPFKANVRSVFGQAFIFALAQASIFYLYSAGFSLGAFLIISDPSAPYHARYTDILRVYAAVVFTALSIGRASSFLPDAQKAQSSASRIFNLIKRVPEIDNYSTEGEVLKNTNGHIEVKNAQFVYPSRPEVPVLQGLSVSVQPGDTLALVGPSGCGKSTVISLIERFYDPLGGCLQLEGHDLRDLNIRWLRNQIGIVSQEPVLFDASIADNIRYGANFRDVSDEEIVEAAKAANIHNFIGTLPEGYSTNVGSKGTQLSGGQKQRIAIARALVRDPKILLLDEATSALDTESEKIVQEALDKAREGRTCIVIAHRLSTIYNADCIAVIHNGNVLEQGTHNELMELEGAYYLLNTVQKKVEKEEEAIKNDE